MGAGPRGGQCTPRAGSRSCQRSRSGPGGPPGTLRSARAIPGRAARVPGAEAGLWEVGGVIAPARVAGGQALGPRQGARPPGPSARGCAAGDCAEVAAAELGPRAATAASRLVPGLQRPARRAPLRRSAPRPAGPPARRAPELRSGAATGIRCRPDRLRPEAGSLARGCVGAGPVGPRGPHGRSRACAVGTFRLVPACSGAFLRQLPASPRAIRPPRLSQRASLGSTPCASMRHTRFGAVLWSP